VLLVIGRIMRPHGIRGEVVVDIATDDPAERFTAGSVLVTDPAEAGPLAIEYVRPHTSAGRQRLLIAFDGVMDREGADTLRGVRLCVDAADLPPPDDPDEFHDHQLVGLAAVTPGGDKLGEVVRVEHAPAQDLLVLRRPGVDRPALVPFVRAIVPEVDLAGGRVVITPPEGLFDL